MKRYFCDYCEQEIRIPLMTIKVKDRMTLHLHYCRECSMKFLEAFQKMEERKEEEGEE